MTIFGLDGLVLMRYGVYNSYGIFPVSISQNGKFMYVLNSGGSRSISSFAFDETVCNLEHLPLLTRSLGKMYDNPLFFIISPAQIGFSLDGNFLVVTLKGINPDPGYLGKICIYSLSFKKKHISLMTTISNGFTPFNFDFNAAGNLLVADAFGSSSFPLEMNGGSVSSY